MLTGTGVLEPAGGAAGPCELCRTCSHLRLANAAGDRASSGEHRLRRNDKTLDRAIKFAMVSGGMAL